MLTSRPEQTEETLPLIPKSKQETKTPTNYLSVGLQCTLGFIGLGAGTLYFGPATDCAAHNHCGTWLNDLAGKQVAVGIYTGSGIDFSAGAMYMGAQSGHALAESISKQPTFLAKVGKGSYILIFATTQNVPLLLTSLSTSPELWQTLLTVGGAAPQSVFGAVNMIDHEIPYYMSETKQLASAIYYRSVHFCALLSEKKEAEWAVAIHYRTQHVKFLENVNARWKHLVAQARKVNIENTQEDSLTFLFQQKDVEVQSMFANLMHKFALLTGASLSCAMSVGGLKNTYSVLQKFIPYSALQILGTTFFNLSQFYGNTILSVHGTTFIVDSMVDVARGRPINSSAFQLRPKTTLAVIGGSLALSALSYAVIAILFLKEFPEESKMRDGFLYGAMAGIDVYHFASLFHLYHLILSRLARDERAQFIFKVEKEVERLNKMTSSEFKKLLETSPPEYLEMLGIEPYIESKNDIENSEVAEAPKAIVPTVPEKNAKKQNESFWSSWCGWLTKSKTEKSNEPKIERKPMKKICCGIM